MQQESDSLKNLKRLVGEETNDTDTNEPTDRRSIFLRFLNNKTGCTDLEGNEARLPLIDQVALAVISKATSGNITAASFLLDNTFGKVTDTPPTEPKKQQLDWSKYTEEDIILLNALLIKGTPDQ
jgi:hypothetical protein